MESKRKKLTSKTYGTDMVRGLAQMRQHDELTDFTVSAEGHSFRVHKTLLAASSDYFKAMVQSVMKESQEQKVDLKGLTASSLRQTLDFLYSGVLYLDTDNLIEVLNAASHLQIHAALDLCSEFMTSMLTFANAEELLHVADTYSLAKVQQCYEQKVLGNFEAFSQSEMFGRLKAAQLARFVANDKLFIRSEKLLFDICALWYSGQQDDGIDVVLKGVRFGLLSEQQLAALQGHWLVAKSPLANSLISKGLQYHRESIRGHPQLSEQTRLRSSHRCLVVVHQDSTHRALEITAYDDREGHFYQLASDMSSSRDWRIASHEDFIYICRVLDCGGGTLMNSLLRFDLRHLRLNELGPCKRLRIDPALVCCGSQLFIFGGVDDHYSITDSIECYDIQSNMWTDVTPSLPHPMHSLAGVHYDGLIYLSGGVSAADRQPTSAMYAFEPNSRVWSRRASMHCPRRLHEMTILSQKIFVLGGIGSHSFHQNTQIPIEAYDIDTDQWTVLTGTLAGRSVGHFITFNDKVMSLGREHQQATEEDIWLYDPEPDEWKAFIKAPRRRMASLASAACTMLHVNFADEKISGRLINDQR